MESAPRPWEYFWTVKHELPLGAAVSYGQSCFLKQWNQSFNFNEADVYLVLIINPLFNRKKGKKNAASDQYETSKLKMFVFSFSVCVNHVVFCVFVKSSCPLDGQQLDTDTIRLRPLFLSCSGSIHPTLVLAALCSVATAISCSQ